jgi:hypothetical protein
LCVLLCGRPRRRVQVGGFVLSDQDFFNAFFPDCLVKMNGTFNFANVKQGRPVPSGISVIHFQGHHGENKPVDYRCVCARPSVASARGRARLPADLRAPRCGGSAAALGRAGGTLRYTRARPEWPVFALFETHFAPLYQCYTSAERAGTALPLLPKAPATYSKGIVRFERFGNVDRKAKKVIRMFKPGACRGQQPSSGADGDEHGDLQI